VAALAVLLTGSRPASADSVGDPEPEPAMIPATTRGTPALWVPGLATFAATYLTGGGVYFGATWHLGECEDPGWFSYEAPDRAAVAACKQERNAEQRRAAPVWIPLVGPFIASHTIREDGSVAGGLIVLGTAQVLSAGAFIAGLAWRHPVPARPRRATSPSVVPVLGPAQAGVAVHGDF
jgi:hypothetical protein